MWWVPAVSTKNDLKALQEAQKAAQQRAKDQAALEPAADVSDLSESECWVRLIIAMYASQLNMGVGVMPDGMAVWIRLRVPASSTDPRAGRVAFVAHNDPAVVLQKAVLALEASPQSNWWKPDRFAQGQAT